MRRPRSSTPCAAVPQALWYSSQSGARSRSRPSTPYSSRQLTVVSSAFATSLGASVGSDRTMRTIKPSLTASSVCGASSGRTLRQWANSASSKKA